MASGLKKRATTVGLLVLTVLATMPSAAFAATPPDANSLIVTDPLPGYALDDSGELNGPIDGGTLMELTGTEPGKVPEAVREIKGQARTWRAADGSVVIVMVMVGDNELTASIMLHSALDASEKATDESFDPGLRGTTGFSGLQSNVHISSVVWRQSNYLVEVLAAGDPPATSLANAKLLAASQAAFLTSLIGVEPTLDDPPSAAGSDDANAAYQVGHVIGVLFVPVLVGLGIWAAFRRRTLRRAHSARLALPPQPFSFPPPALFDQAATHGEQVDSELATNRSPDPAL